MQASTKALPNLFVGMETAALPAVPLDTTLLLEATSVAHRSYGSIRTRSQSSRSVYTWRRRKGPHLAGLTMLTLMCALAMLMVSSRPLAWEHSAAAWAHSGNRSALGDEIRRLAEEDANLVENPLFAPDPSGAPYSWTTWAGRAGSTVRSAYIENTPPGAQLLELVPLDGDRAIAHQWIPVDNPADLSFAVAAYALSTMGDARVVLQFEDEQGRSLGTLGWVMVGGLPGSGGLQQWYDHRTRANYQGSELTLVVDIPTALKEIFHVNPSRLQRVGIQFEASDGQHLLVQGVFLGNRSAHAVQAELDPVIAEADMMPESSAPVDPTPEPTPVPGLNIALNPQSVQTSVGEKFTVTAVLTNETDQPLGPLTAEFLEPYGFGLTTTGSISLDVSTLAPGSSAELLWEITARRAHEVNMGQPWEYGISVSLPSGEKSYSFARAEVVDPRPGKLFYVLTEDLEPMDSAGYPTRFTGNRNAWLDPEEFRVQLIEKSEAMNRIADHYGAKWSHYIAWPIVLGAEWAAQQSTTGAWELAIADLKESIVREAAKGHQYAPHLHIDYDYRLPHTFLSYHEPTDGFWANHREHGWAHQIPATGGYDVLYSRTGTLFDYVRRLDELLRGTGHGQQLATRTGSFDFGVTTDDQRASVEAFRAVGLWASSDAHGNVGGSTSAPFGENIYFTRPDSINHKAESLDQIGIVQFLPTPSRAIMFEAESIESANAKVDDAVRIYAPSGTVRPGVHSIVAFTHAMFMLGEGDWRSTRGGAFSVLDHHLAYVHGTYVEPGVIEFATSNEMIKAWLDYYAPTLLALRGPEIPFAEPGVYEYPIELVGEDIPVGGRFRHEVEVQYPLYLAEKLLWVGIYRDDELIAESFDVPNATHSLSFTVDRPGEYRMVVICSVEG